MFGWVDETEEIGHRFSVDDVARWFVEFRFQPLVVCSVDGLNQAGHIEVQIIWSCSDHRAILSMRAKVD